MHGSISVANAQRQSGIKQLLEFRNILSERTTELINLNLLVYAISAHGSYLTKLKCSKYILCPRSDKNPTGAGILKMCQLENGIYMHYLSLGPAHLLGSRQAWCFALQENLGKFESNCSEVHHDNLKTSKWQPPKNEYLYTFKNSVLQTTSYMNVSCCLGANRY